MKQFQGSDTYIASPELVRSVNIAAALQKPLLIKGEPGTGKTMLAQSIADSLGMKLFIWNIKSTTKAQDGLYVYDTVQRLYDSQFGAEGVDDIKNTSIWASWARLLAKISRASFSLMKSIRRTWNFPMTSCGNWTAWNFTFPKRGRRSAPKRGPLSSLRPMRKRNCRMLSCAVASSTTLPSPIRT